MRRTGVLECAGGLGGEAVGYACVHAAVLLLAGRC